MISKYNIVPKIKVFEKGLCFKTKQEILGFKEPELNPPPPSDEEEIDKVEETTKMIDKGTVLIYLEDAQFYSNSKILKQPMSAWIMAKVITPLGETLWIPAFCLSKAVWEFKTYAGRKKAILEDVNNTFEIISMGLNASGNTIIEKEKPNEYSRCEE